MPAPRALPLMLALLLAAPALPASGQEAEPAAGSAAGGEAAAPAPEPPAITVSRVEPRVLRDRVIASGLVAAVEEVAVQPLIEGQPIEALLADVGDRVEEGQVLARLSTSSLELQRSQLEAQVASVRAQVAQARASLAQAEANAAEAERQATRNAELAEAGSVPRAQADQSRASAEAARAAVDVAREGIGAAEAQGELVRAQIADAELQLSRAEVKAPVAGVVTARNAQVGAIASGAGSPMFTLVRDGAMELRAEVSELDLMRLAPGQKATLRASLAAEPIEGTVRLVEPLIDAQTRLGTARISIDDPSRVVEGMFLSAEILVAQAETLAVPVTALGSSGGSPTVMRVVDGVVEQTDVVPGLRDGDLVGIAGGVAEGDLVVTKAAAFVRAGDRINPVPDDATVASAAPEAASEPTPAAAPDAAGEAGAGPAPEPEAAQGAEGATP